MSAKTDAKLMDAVKLKRLLDVSVSDERELFRLVVDTPFELKVDAAFLFLGITVLLLANKATGMIDRVALSNTELAKNTTDVSYVPFEEIKIPLDNHEGNIIAKAIQSGKPQDTTDWKFLFDPALTPQQARINQASAGIAYSAVYPFSARNGGAMIFSYYQYASEIGEPQHKFMKNYISLVDERLKKGVA